MQQKPLKIVYLTPALYMAGGVERVLTLKANYFAEHFGYDITIILTEGCDKPLFYKLSDKIKVINLNIGFEELWTCSFVKKIFVYLKKQRQFKKALTKELMRLRPDITISLLRREINFLNDIKDGSRKIGELHVNRANYRNFEANDSNCVKSLFAKFWMRSLVSNLKKLDRFVVLTEEDKSAWPELQNICVIPDPLSFSPTQHSLLTEKRVIAVGRYVYQKGFDLLLQAWTIIEKQFSDWELVVFGDGNREPYEHQMKELGIDKNRCHLNGPTADIQKEYVNSSIFAFSSRFEGFGMVLVEAMACGLPVVSFACPCGPKDIVRDGEDGFLVENGNVDDLAQQLIKLMADDNLRTAFAHRAHQDVQRFNMEHIASRWKSLFESCVKR
ncbi:MAG: glycosyltransferase family 4 protein [Prevotella sp.]|nr:glycosyltransferase family 4 protein [Prevotella sp.]